MVPVDADAVLWSAPADERAGRPVLVLLHGYGSDERDLFGLAPFLPAEFVVAAVRAPLSPPFPTPGWSWYPIEGLDAPGGDAVTTAARSLIDWLDAATPAEGTVGLLGFSQGAAVALQALRLQPDRFAFVVNLAGYVDSGALPTDEHLAEGAEIDLDLVGKAARRSLLELAAIVADGFTVAPSRTDPDPVARPAN